MRRCSPVIASSTFLPLLLLFSSPAAATYSIVATDQATQSVGGAVASCVGSQGVLIVYGPAPGKGGINAQAQANQNGRDEGVTLLTMGTAPADIITQITSPSFDPSYNQRQYGVADLQGRAAGFTGTGTNVAQYREDRQGTLGTFTYSVQGNVLTGAAVINQAEAAFRGGGCDLAEKLMLALEGGAQNGQGDKRCINDAGVGVPANAASIEVDLVGQSAGSYLKLSNAQNGSVNAVVQLRSQFNTWRQTHPCMQPDGGTPDASVDAGSKDVSTDVTTDRSDSTDVSVGNDAGDGSAGSGGVAGTAGTGGTGGLGGDAGASTGGKGGTAGAGGRGGSGGIVGTGGMSGTAGQGGAAGTAGNGGSGPGGATGSGGAAGSAGATGSGGASGSTGGTSSPGGRGGTGGTSAGSGGSTADDGGCSCRTMGRSSDERSGWILVAMSAAIASARACSRRRRTSR